MPKSQIVEPAKERKAGTISFAEVPLNQYQQDIAKEKEAYGADSLVGMYEDMLLIREFENMLQSIKTQGSYEGIEYDHKGPAHLSIGQEASAVGQAFLLGVEDHILGSHRNSCQRNVSNS
jgi:2-oxoisovalerate dehydrogenase E1 component